MGATNAFKGAALALDQDYYLHNCSREDAVAMLGEARVGDYLLRQSSRGTQAYAITVRIAPYGVKVSCTASDALLCY